MMAGEPEPENTRGATSQTHPMIVQIVRAGAGAGLRGKSSCHRSQVTNSSLPLRRAIDVLSGCNLPDSPIKYGLSQPNLADPVYKPLPIVRGLK